MYERQIYLQNLMHKKLLHFHKLQLMWGTHIKYLAQSMGCYYINIWIFNSGKVKQGGEGA